MLLLMQLLLPVLLLLLADLAIDASTTYGSSDAADASATFFVSFNISCYPAADADVALSCNFRC